MGEDEWDEASEWEEDLDEWAERLGSTGGEGEAAAACADAPTPGERLLYSLGQLYALWYRGELDVAPQDFDVEDLARIIGVARDIELVSDGEFGRSYHFAGEVLLVDDERQFPWRLLDVKAWAWLTDEHNNH